MILKTKDQSIADIRANLNYSPFWFVHMPEGTVDYFVNIEDTGLISGLDAPGFTFRANIHCTNIRGESLTPNFSNRFMCYPSPVWSYEFYSLSESQYKCIIRLLSNRRP